MRDPNTRIPRKIGGTARVQAGDAHTPAAKLPPLPAELIGAVNADGTPDLKELESKGLLPKYLRLWNNPATLRQLKNAVGLLKADKVDLKDKAAVQSWAVAHKADLEAGDIKQNAQAKTVVRTEPSVGRNDPCPCGSGKKFKKCCDK